MAKIKPLPITGLILICKNCNLEKDSSLFPQRKARNGRKALIDEKSCKTCVNIRVSEWYNRNRSTQLEKMKHYHKTNKEKQAELNRKNYIENKERYNNQSKEWRAVNPHMMTAYVRNYNLSKSNRTPEWADLKLINEIYKKCPTGMSIDHIHPLNGKLISGFHIETNLQYLTRSKNSEKSNKFNTYWVFYETSRIRIETSGTQASIYSINR